MTDALELRRPLGKDFQMDANVSTELPGCGGRLQLRIHGPMTAEGIDLLQSFIALAEKMVLTGVSEAPAPILQESQP